MKGLIMKKTRKSDRGAFLNPYSGKKGFYKGRGRTKGRNLDNLESYSDRGKLWEADRWLRNNDKRYKDNYS